MTRTKTLSEGPLTKMLRFGQLPLKQKILQRICVCRPRRDQSLDNPGSEIEDSEDENDSPQSSKLLRP